MEVTVYSKDPNLLVAALVKGFLAFCRENPAYVRNNYLPNNPPNEENPNREVINYQEPRPDPLNFQQRDSDWLPEKRIEHKTQRKSTNSPDVITEIGCEEVYVRRPKEKPLDYGVRVKIGDKDSVACFNAEKSLTEGLTLKSSVNFPKFLRLCRKFPTSCKTGYHKVKNFSHKKGISLQKKSLSTKEIKTIIKKLPTNKEFVENQRETINHSNVEGFLITNGYFFALFIKKRFSLFFNFFSKCFPLNESTQVTKIFNIAYAHNFAFIFLGTSLLIIRSFFIAKNIKKNPNYDKTWLPTQLLSSGGLLTSLTVLPRITLVTHTLFNIVLKQLCVQISVQKVSFWAKTVQIFGCVVLAFLIIKGTLFCNGFLVNFYINLLTKKTFMFFRKKVDD